MKFRIAVADPYASYEADLKRPLNKHEIETYYAKTSVCQISTGIPVEPDDEERNVYRSGFKNAVLNFRDTMLVDSLRVLIDKPIRTPIMPLLRMVYNDVFFEE